MTKTRFCWLCTAVLAVSGLVAVAQAAGDACPAATLAGQNPRITGGGNWQYSDTTLQNEFGSGRIMCESFPPPNEPPLSGLVGAITWHAAYTNLLDPPNHDGCFKPHKYEIKFYPNLGTFQPDVLHPVATYTVDPEVARIVGIINWSDGGTSDRFMLGAVLDPPFDPSTIGGRGWVSIASVQQATLCFAAIGDATEGDGQSWRYWMDKPTQGKFYPNDIHYCLGEYVPGACCDDWSGVCTNDSDHFLCDLQGNRFTTGTCNDLDPLCGQKTGACCKADQSCTPGLTRSACEATPGAYWRGPDTTCDDCCWIPACPGGAHVETEVCGESSNGGCLVAPPVFETIPVNGVVCGTVWAEGGRADQDWYEITLTQQAEFILQNIETQIPIRLTPYFSQAHTPPNCDELWYFVQTLWTPCQTGQLAPPDVWPPGRYWITVRPEDADGPVVDFYPCDTANEYSFELLTEYITCPDPCNIPGAQVVPEGEPDYCTTPAPDTFNSGCDQLTSPPGPALPITDNFVLWCGRTGWYDLPSQVCPGDLDCNDFVDFGDINPFVLALSNWSAWLQQNPDCPEKNADVNQDGIYGGANGFGDINPFVALLASGGGNPIPCFQDRDLVPDTDWYSFEVKSGPKEVSFFVYAEAPMTWEIWSQAAGCSAPPRERHNVTPCLSVSKKTFCLPVGQYWLRMAPSPGVECGKEYALGLEEQASCQPCNVDCNAQDIRENENCGEHLNDTCNTQAMVIADPLYQNEKVICGTIYNLLAPEEESDDDWYKFDVPAGPNQYLVVVLNSDFPLTPWMTIQGCDGTGWLTQDGIGCDPLGDLNGFFVDKEDVPGGSHVDLHITTSLYSPDEGGWYDNPGHFPCPNQYRMLAGYSPTEPSTFDTPGIKWHKLTLMAPARHMSDAAQEIRSE